MPYRSEVSHKYAFHFKDSQRAKLHKSGLDYTKIIIISNKEYISDETALIDNDEYVETIHNIEQIKSGALKFVEDYVEHVKGHRLLNTREFNRRYGYSTLQYFHKELGVETK